jgi:ribosomal protein L22
MSPDAKTPENDEPQAEQAPQESAEATEAVAKADTEGESETKAPAKRKARAKKAPADKAEKAEKPAAEGKAAAEKKPAAQKKAPAKKAAAAKESAEKSESKPASKRSGKAPAKPRRRVVRAHARYVRTSARKARMVCRHLPGKSVQEARAILAFTPREVAGAWSKLLESAVANAESNHELLEDELIVREAYADEGPTIKRFRPRAMGRAAPIRKRTSHLTITLTPRPEPGTKKNHG